MSNQDKIIIKGAREHNLKNINLELPRDKLIVMTGLSGSGKSSLAFDTIYAEGQRRYVESLSAYARQFLGQMEKPDVDHIEGLSPAISIDQKSSSRNPRSTVGTVTEIYDYLRVLYARIGIPYCPECGKEISAQSAEEIVEAVLRFPEGTKFQILAPVVSGRKGEYKKLIDNLRREGYVRVRIDGVVHNIDEEIELGRYNAHNIEVMIDRLVIKKDIRSRLADSIETALRVGEGMVIIAIIDGAEHIYSEKYACPKCGISLPELSPRLFSFNSPYGACPYCTGLGTKMEVDPKLVVPNENLSLAEGAIEPFAKNTINYYKQIIVAVAEHYGIDMDTPWRDLKEKEKEVIFHGTGDEQVFVRYRSVTGRQSNYWTNFSGVIGNLARRHQETDSEYSRESIERYMSLVDCPVCHGKRLKPDVLSVKVGGINIAELSDKTAGGLLEFFSNLELSKRDAEVSRRLIKEIIARVKFMNNVGLDYLTLSRAANTLAGGEAQRIRLATQIGSGLVGVLYILDEPSIGLHQRDNRRLIQTLIGLRDLGNTVIVVEHDEETIRTADYIVDIGPGAGEHGGKIVEAGTLDMVLANPKSLTGQYLSGTLTIPMPQTRRKPQDKWLKIINAREHNLKGIDVDIPLGLMTCVTGVSGSGKSTLVSDILSRALRTAIYRSKDKAGAHERIIGIENIDKVIEIDQSPIGRTPRSNPATYIKVFDEIRQLYAKLPEAKMRGYRPGRFSFNVRGGRCEACQGEGTLKIEMHFLPDVYITCEVCKGRRFNSETLEVKFKGKSIADVLEMSVEEALRHFANIPNIKRRLEMLNDVGLGYMRLGQPATTLSGGEAQRVKLSAELGKRSTGTTFYILDEPTTGLHFADIEKLLDVLQRLVDAGNTVLIIEHNLDVIKSCDYVVDLGPHGGEKGGELIVAGTPEEVAKAKNSYTGHYLAEELKKSEGK